MSDSKQNERDQDQAWFDLLAGKASLDADVETRLSAESLRAAMLPPDSGASTFAVPAAEYGFSSLLLRAKAQGIPIPDDNNSRQQQLDPDFQWFEALGGAHLQDVNPEIRASAAALRKAVLVDDAPEIAIGTDSIPIAFAQLLARAKGEGLIPNEDPAQSLSVKRGRISETRLGFLEQFREVFGFLRVNPAPAMAFGVLLICVGLFSRMSFEDQPKDRSMGSNAPILEVIFKDEVTVKDIGALMHDIHGDIVGRPTLDGVWKVEFQPNDATPALHKLKQLRDESRLVKYVGQATQ